MGDFNYTADSRDYTTRTVSPIETILRLKISMLTEALNVKDSYRQMHPQGGFTWGHRNSSNIRSRIDRIFITKSLEVFESNVVADFDQSDHSLLSSKFLINSVIQWGPGYYKINPTILETDQIKKDINQQINHLINSVPQHFNPHLKWDYIKMGIRNIFMTVSSIENKSNKFELECAEKELNSLQLRLEHLLIENKQDDDLSVRALKIEI